MNELKERLSKTLENLKQKFSSVRTGRANPDLLAFINVDYYGSKIPIKQLASITSTDGNTLVLNVFDSNAIQSIEKAIQTSNLGLNPQADGTIIRLKLPDLTEDRRNELIRYIGKLSEEGKIALRNIRRDALDTMKNQNNLSEDAIKRESDTVQQIINEFIKKIDDLYKNKEEEIKII